ncbi:hypothetical protein KCP76_20130 [Salmonella enterica subsp. enterica serovar Weltevreden]|nr:hypothetical protein KCP76_20130 [Salmonella enterica subsp. enterica serovar Weltevreden]
MPGKSALKAAVQLRLIRTAKRSYFRHPPGWRKTLPAPLNRWVGQAGGSGPAR